MKEVKKKRSIIGILMKEQGFSQTSLANLSGVPQSVISRYSRNSELYNIAYLFALAGALKKESINQLFIDAE